MTTVPSTFLNNSRQQIVRAFAIGVIASAALFGVIVLGLLFAQPNLGLWLLLALVALDITVGVITLSIYRTRPLWQAIAPLAAILALGVILAGLVFPEAKVAISTIFIIIVLLINLIGDQRITIGAVVACTLVIGALIAAPAIPGLVMSFGWALPFVEASALLAVLVLVWLISDRQTASLTAAIGQTNQRAAEAEAARAEVEQRNRDQARLLDLVQSLELPVIPIGQGVLVMPLVGSLDSRRVEAIQRRLLDMVSQERAHTVVLDVTGISVIDTSVARQLLLTAQAVRLLGARTMLSGISAQVAQTLVTLGVALDDLQPVGDLGQALETARHN